MISYQSIFQNLQLGILSIVTKVKNYFQRNVKKQKHGFSPRVFDLEHIVHFIFASIPFFVGLFLYLIIRKFVPIIGFIPLLWGFGYSAALMFLV